MSKRTVFVCNNCGAVSAKWMGRCAECGSWNSIEEVLEERKQAGAASYRPTAVKSVRDITITQDNRMQTGIGELDLALGGGIVRGSLVLVGGDPGIGKSTLVLQMASNLSEKGKKVLYISGEESESQIKMRANRLGVRGDNLYLLTTTSLENVLGTVDVEKPDILIVDSIQTVSTQTLSAPAGSVSQVKEVCAGLLRLAKGKGIATFLIGHVTKTGNIAGPKILEHMVDTVLYFEGDAGNLYRILRSVKNRFGSTNELGIFSMSGKGLIEVKNPSELFVSGTQEEEPGTVVFALLEGTRPLLVEIQSLVADTNFSNPRRMSIGLSYESLLLSCAILEKKRGFFLQNKDIYVNAVGGIDVDEPACSLAIIVSIASSLLSKPVAKNCVILGEVGLLGEVRAISQIGPRLQEAKRLGYTKAIIPDQDVDVQGMQISKVRNVDDVFEVVFSA